MSGGFKRRTPLEKRGSAATWLPASSGRCDNTPTRGGEPATALPGLRAKRNRSPKTQEEARFDLPSPRGGHPDDTARTKGLTARRVLRSRLGGDGHRRVRVGVGGHNSHYSPTEGRHSIREAKHRAVEGVSHSRGVRRESARRRAKGASACFFPEHQETN